MSYRMVTLPSDENVQFVGVYALKCMGTVVADTTEPIVGFVEDKSMLSDEAMEVIDDWMNVHGFETRYIALQDLLLEFREMMHQEEQDYRRKVFAQEVFAQIEYENKESEEEL